MTTIVLWLTNTVWLIPNHGCQAAGRRLPPTESLIAAVREQEEAARFLAWPGDFDLDRGDHVEEVHLASGSALEGFAGDGAGSTYFFCGEGGEERPILYADSEGGVTASHDAAVRPVDGAEQRLLQQVRPPRRGRNEH
ncbi:hypothetical protein [Streptomyces sp. NPDC058249]|uniref:hypothetical protein n=1 Tax=Streptomyces sp. NPDC058249 TaxID=3346403 RepID=UPI0036E53F5D